jgi:Rieske Fe-S protein
MTISRREFVKLTGATVLCACACVGFSGCSIGVSNVPLAPKGSYRREANRIIVSLTAVEELHVVGGAVRLALGDGHGSEVKVLVVHSGENEYLAFSNRCTHRGKELNYLKERRKLECISGKSQFDLEGNMVLGPAN